MGVLDALVNLLSAAAREPTAAIAELSPRGLLAVLQVLSLAILMSYA